MLQSEVPYVSSVQPAVKKEDGHSLKNDGDNVNNLDDSRFADAASGAYIKNDASQEVGDSTSSIPETRPPVQQKSRIAHRKRLSGVEKRSARGRRKTAGVCRSCQTGELQLRQRKDCQTERKSGSHSVTTRMLIAVCRH